LARNFYNKFGAFPHKELPLFSYDGKVLGDSDANFNQMENHLSRKRFRMHSKGMSVKTSAAVDFEVGFALYGNSCGGIECNCQSSVPLVQIKKLTD